MTTSTTRAVNALVEALEAALLHEPQDDSCAPWVADARAALPHMGGAAEPVASETHAQEFSRLIREYETADPLSSVKEEAWNLIADFAIENATRIRSALAASPADDRLREVVEALEAARSVIDECRPGYIPGTENHARVDSERDKVRLRIDAALVSLREREG